MGNSELKEKTANSLLWGGLSNGIQQILSALFGIILARLLSPGDYGMIGMLAIFTGLANSLQEGGFIAALTNKQNVSHEDFNAVFWFNILVGIIIYIILFACAPLIASFFNHPELLWLSRILFLGFLIGSFGTAQIAYLFKYLYAKERAKADIGALLVSNCAAVIMAINGMAYWGIAIQTVLYVLTGTVLRWYYSPWRPTIIKTFEPIKHFFKFSIKLVFTSIIFQVTENIFSILLGKFYSVQQVGYYSQGNKWMKMGSSITGNMISGVAQPVLSQMTKEREREKNAFNKMVQYISCLSFPLMFGLALISKELLVITITDKWLPAVTILQILCVWGAFSPIYDIYRNLAISHGKSDFYFISNLIFCLLQICILLFMVKAGILKMVMMYVALYFIWLIIWHAYSVKLIDLNTTDIIHTIIPSFLSTILSFTVGLLFSKFFDGIWMQLLSKFIGFSVCYLILFRFTNKNVYFECKEYFIHLKTNLLYKKNQNC